MPLRRGIRTRHTQLNTSREEEGTGGGVIELTPVVTLDGLNGEVKPSGHPGKEVEGREGLRLGAQRKSPRIMREIINHHQIVFITRKAGLQEKSTGHSEQNQRHASHAKKKKKKKV